MTKNIKEYSSFEILREFNKYLSFNEFDKAAELIRPFNQNKDDSLIEKLADTYAKHIIKKIGTFFIYNEYNIDESDDTIKNKVLEFNNNILNKSYLMASIIGEDDGGKVIKYIIKNYANMADPEWSDEYSEKIIDLIKNIKEHLDTDFTKILNDSETCAASIPLILNNDKLTSYIEETRNFDENKKLTLASEKILNRRLNDNHINIEIKENLKRII